MTTINGYKLKAELHNANSGFSKWGFATKNGKEYFIKELINPVYPIDREAMSEEVFNKRRNFCHDYERRFSAYFSKINNASRGSLTRIIEFFRYESKYYLITEKIDGVSVSMPEIAALPEQDKFLLMKTVAMAFADLHRVGIVHFDVKPSNIIVKRTAGRRLTAKVIDFDSGFQLGDMLDSEELGGDLTYLAPETFLGIAGEEVAVTEKADIFALGLIFHEYYCGALPYYDKSNYDYPYESSLDTGTLGIAKAMMPDNLYKLISSMLDPDPDKRPSAEEIAGLIDRIHEPIIEENLTVTYLGVNFGDVFGRSIAVYPDCIRYRNTSCSEVVPESYYEQKDVPLDAQSFETVIGEIEKLGLQRILSLRDSEYPGEEYTVAKGITCVMNNGKTYDYVAGGAFDDKFKKISTELSKHCAFPSVPGKAETETAVQPEEAPAKSFFHRAGNL